MGNIVEVQNSDRNIYLTDFTKFTEVENKVDTKMVSILEKEFGEDAVFQQKVEENKLISSEYAEKINSLFPSKKDGNNNGRPDCIVITNTKISRVDIIVDNKNSKISITEGINDALKYANAVIQKGFDNKIVIASNGIACVLKVYDVDNMNWVSFKINGEEVHGIPSRMLVDLIYNENAIGIKTDLSNKKFNSQIITSVLDELEEIYYSKYKDLVENKNNQKKIDFTIALVVLKTLLEKHKEIFLYSDMNEDIQILYMKPKTVQTTLDSKKIKKAIISCLSIIFNEEQQYDEYITELIAYRDVFKIRDEKNKNKIIFNFKSIIEDMGKIDINKDKCLVADIYRQIYRLENLHNSDIDLFGEIYEKLMNNKTKKDFGQFFTKRNLTRVLGKILFKDDIVVLINEYIDGMDLEFQNANFERVIIDFACGTGGLIIEPVHLAKSELRNGSRLDKFITDNNLDCSKKIKYIDIILKNFSSKCIYAGDIAGENIARTKVNMFFAGDGFSNVAEIDTLNENELNELLRQKKIDYLITNVPMGSKTDVIIKDGNNIISNKKVSENQFLIQSIKYLKNGTGKAMIILPDGIFEGTDNYELREWVLKNCKINYIIGFPKFSFAPYTHEKTYALFLEKRSIPLEYIVEESDENNSIILNPALCAEKGIYMYIVDCDGMANSDKRFLTKETDLNGKWLHDEVSEWYDISGKCHQSILEECIQKKEINENDAIKSINEWDYLIEGKKCDFIKFEDILNDKILVRGKLIKKIEMPLSILKQAGIHKDKVYSKKELLALYKKGCNYITDALKNLDLNVDFINNISYSVSKNGKILTKKEFDKFIIDNQIFGLSDYKVEYDFKKSKKIKVTDINTNKVLAENKINKALELENIKINENIKKSKDVKILNSSGEEISTQTLDLLNEWIRNNNDNYRIEEDSTCLSELLKNEQDEEKTELVISYITEQGYEIDEDDNYKIYELYYKRLINLLPESYLRPVKLVEIEYEKYKEELSYLTEKSNIDILANKGLGNSILEEKIEEAKFTLDKIRQLLSKKIVFKELDSILVRDVFNLRKGVTINEVDLYKNKGLIPVYSSQSLNQGEFGRCSEEYYNTCRKKGHKDELTWTTNGNAGVVFYRRAKYLFTEKCGQMRVKAKYKDSCNLEYFEIILNQRTIEYLTSREGNGKLEIQNMGNVKIQVPNKSIQDEIVQLEKKGKIAQRRLEFIITELELLQD